MATLGNLLLRRGGLPMTPRFVVLTLLLPAVQGGPPQVEQTKVALLPVSHDAEAKANRSAIDFIADHAGSGDAPLLEKEMKLRFVVEAMRDPDDLRKYFVEADRVADFRNCLIGEQLDYLLREYRALIESEYAELMASAGDIKAEAKSLFQDGQG